MLRSKPYKLFYFLSIFLIPALLIVVVFIYKVDRKLYFDLTQEDQLLEWATFGFLFISGILAITIAVRFFKRVERHFWFFTLFGIFCILFSLEEISWGQRIFDVESPEFFLENSDQQEINAHNVIQKTFNVKTKHIAGWTLFFYGTFLPLVLFFPRLKAYTKKIGLVVPPAILALSFLIAALMMLDKPTGREEEFGEFFFSLCFFMFMGAEYLKNERQG